MKDDVIITIKINIDKDTWEQCLFDVDKSNLLLKLASEKAKSEVTLAQMTDCTQRIMKMVED